MMASPGARPVLTIFYQFDPWGSGVGGIDTMIRTWVRHAPPQVDLRIVGADRRTAVHGRWRDAELCGRRIRFMSVIGIDDPNVKPMLPHTLRFAWAIGRLGSQLSSDFMHFHRIEPTLATLAWPGDKTLFFHIDIEKQLAVARGGNEFGWRRFPAAYFALERLLIGRFHQVYECNSAALSFHRNRYPALRHRFQFFRNCVDLDVHAPLPPPERDRQRRVQAAGMGLAADTQFVMFAGRLQPMKNPRLLLQAFARVANPAAHLLVAGDGDLRETMRQDIDALGLAGRVSMLGALAPQRLRDLLQVSDAFCLTSTYEGLPVAVLEALACGVPVVTTRSGETPGFLGADAGIVCDDPSPSAIAAALDRVLGHREQFASSACRKAVAPYSARLVLDEAYGRMLQQWDARQRGCPVNA